MIATISERSGRERDRAVLRRCAATRVPASAKVNNTAPPTLIGRDRFAPSDPLGIKDGGGAALLAALSVFNAIVAIGTEELVESATAQTVWSVPPKIDKGCQSA